MTALASDPTGEALIESKFRVSGRGWMLVFLDSPETFKGKVFSGGVVESDRGAAPHKGPDFVDATNRKPRIGVLVRDEAGTLFEIGQWVRFYKSAERSA
jgi:hypothetical protein